MQYKRDFTDENLSRIQKYLDEVTREEVVWDRVFSHFDQTIQAAASVLRNLARAIVSIFIKFDGDISSREIESYYKTVLSKNKELRSCLKTIFDNANAEDVRYAAHANRLLDSGNEILTELNYLISVATVDGITGILNSTAPNIVLEYPEDLLNSISDEELIAFCKSNNVSLVNSDYWDALVAANSAVTSVDGVDMFLVILFKGMDISVDVIADELSRGGGVNTKNWIIKQMLDGKEGFMSVGEIAEQLGYDKETIRTFLENGNMPLISGSSNADKFKQIAPMSAMDFAKQNELKAKIDQIIAQHMQRVYSEDALFEQYCADNGLDAEYIRSLRADGYNSYEKQLYYKNLGKVLEAAGGSDEYRKQFDFKLSSAKKMLGTIKKEKGVYESLFESGKEYKHMGENDILSDTEIRNFLKTYGGYDKVTKDDITLFRDVSDSVEGIGGASKIVGYSKNALDAIAYWSADFSRENEILDSLMASAKADNPSYYAALAELKTKYTDKFQTTLNETAVNLEKELITKGIEVVTNKVSAVAIAQEVIDVAGVVTGANGYTDAVMDLMTYPEMTSQMMEAYNNSVAEVAAGNEEAVVNLRLNFTALKETMTSYYDVSCKYYSGGIGGIGADYDHLNYSKYMAKEVGKLELGQTFEFMSYNEFIKYNS